MSDPLRLVKPDGEPTLTRDQARLLAETRALRSTMQSAFGIIDVALADDKPESCAVGVRMLMNISLLLNDYARAAGC